MTDWKKMAEAMDPPIPPADVPRLIPVLEALEVAFRPLARSILPDADVWTGVEDAE
jgi:hypothetical protein